MCTEHFTDFFHHVEYRVSFVVCLFRLDLYLFCVELKELPVVEIGSGATKGEHLVHFGCTYSVSVQASPMILPGRPQVVNITVPGL